MLKHAPCCSEGQILVPASMPNVCVFMLSWREYDAVARIRKSSLRTKFPPKSRMLLLLPPVYNTSGTGAFGTRSFIIERLVGTDLLVT